MNGLQGNQEDSIILNQGWVDRGGGRSTIYKTYKAETKKHKILPDDKFEKPNREEIKSKLDELGIEYNKMWRTDKLKDLLETN